MNHPSEWTQILDKRTGRRRYKHKGSGVVRDTLLAIRKTLKKGATEAVKKVVQRSAEKASKKLSEAALEKGSDKIQQILQKRRSKTRVPNKKSVQKAPSRQKTSSQDAMMMLSQILGNKI